MTKKYIRPKYSDIVVRDREITAANERIRELQEQLRDAKACCFHESEVAESYKEQLTSEREVSDKLEWALREIAVFRQGGVLADSLRQTANTALAEVAAIRATHTNREQA